jgi:nitrogen-specific signal transduction histidine kinase/ActR/RegA family two-component response regulator
MDRKEHADFEPSRKDAEVDLNEEPLRQKELLVSKFHKMEALGLFADGIARDFNNILSNIIGFTDLALDDAKKDSVQEDNLRRALLAAERARQLTQRIQVIARRSFPPKRNVLLRPLMEDALGLVRTAISHAVTVEADLQPDTKAVLADPTEIHEIVWNIAVNADEAMNGRGTLTVSLYEKKIDSPQSGQMGAIQPGEYSIIEVSDTGRGMDDTVLKQAFEPFFTTKEPGKGTGMGLAVVFGIVQSHGGNLTVESTPGKGSVFRVFLPKSGVSADDASGAFFSETPILGTERILFADDDPGVAEVASRLLSGSGYSVVLASSGEEALTMLSNPQDHFDLVITDQSMKDIAGFELSKKIRTLKPELPVVLCTGHLSDLSTETAEAVGIERYLMKPLTRKELVRTVRDVLDQKQK